MSTLRTLVCPLLVWTLLLANAAASENDARKSGPDGSPGKASAEAMRPLAPTTDELEQFTLRPDGIGLPAGELPPEGGTPLFQLSGLGMFVASGADFATTEIGLSRGLEEGNPMAANRSVRLLHHVVGPAAVWWTTTELQKNGKTKLATAIRVALMAAYGYATLHNLRQVDGLR